MTNQLTLPEEDAERGRYPLADGLFDYFPNALCAVAEVSKVGNDKHNPGEKMHHARGKSTDHRNKILRHLLDTGSKDAAGLRHSAYVAWRALALLQEEIEAQDGAPMARGAKPAATVESAIMPELREECAPYYTRVNGVVQYFDNLARPLSTDEAVAFDRAKTALGGWPGFRPKETYHD